MPPEGISFEEEKRTPQASFARRDSTVSRFLIEKNIVENESQATRVLVAVSVSAVLIALGIWWFGGFGAGSATPPPDPDAFITV